MQVSCVDRTTLPSNSITPFTVFSVTYTICEGPKLDAYMSQSVRVR